MLTRNLGMIWRQEKNKIFPVVYSVKICYVKEGNVMGIGDLISLFQTVYIYFYKTVSIKVFDTTELCQNLNIEFTTIFV